jgi:alpha-L-fucosidase
MLNGILYTSFLLLIASDRLRYWWDMNAGPDTSDQTYEYNLENYGPHHEYDDFIQNFTASAWDPKEWVDLFADAGANYFVHVTKHHDGFALFDVSANATLRTSVAQNPHRDFVQVSFFWGRTMDQTVDYQRNYLMLQKSTSHNYGEVHISVYQNGLIRLICPMVWDGGQGVSNSSCIRSSILTKLVENATNPYTDETLPYTGFVEVEDFLQDIMLPQLESLAAMGTDIIWCDAGGANVTVDFAAPYFNNAASESRQVVMNNRCGIPGDFDTPEYSQLSIAQSRKWESNLGMDPFVRALEVYKIYLITILTR